MRNAPYVLITPVRNEEATIGTTIESVVRQTIPPKEWIIVSDGSTDRTDQIVQAHAAEAGFLRLLRLENRPARNFASVVFALEAGIAALKTEDYGFIGLLDGDVKFGPDYYEQILSRFQNDPRLGLAGGLVIDCCQGRRRRQTQSLKDVAGAVQLFRRECYGSLGGLVPLPEGGWDGITCVRARMNGFKVRTFPEIEVDHLKPRNVAEGNLLRRTWQLGIREYALGNHPLFEVVKCGYRCFEYPYFIGGITRLAGYIWCCLGRRKRKLAAETIRFIHREQWSRLLRFRRPELAALKPTRVEKGPTLARPSE
jgi:biofilm PGA synthesis N-glycosyltransferase PgaC